jgi:nitronate monooxygenase
MTVAARSSDILYTPAISGVAANFLRKSIVAAGLDPDNLVAHGALDMRNEANAWKNVWSAGQGVAAINDLPGAAELCDQLVAEYAAAMATVASDPFVNRGARA